MLTALVGFSTVLSAEVSKTPIPLAELAGEAATPNEKEYYDATVLLIDHTSGMLGVKQVDEGTAEEKKFSFIVDAEYAHVTNNVNQYLEFSDIAVGDSIDIYTEIDKNGKESVFEIVDYSQIEKE